MLRVLLLAIGVLVVVSFLPIESNPPSAIADPAFSRYQRQAGAQGRALLWGGDPLISVVEPYIGAPGDRRLVEYYDRGRLEIDATSGAGVTDGQLVREMVSGAVQQGTETVLQQAPADIPLLSGADEDQLPSYADIADLTAPGVGGARTSGQPIDAWLDEAGNVHEATPPTTVLPNQYIEETGHSLPDVFTQWMLTRPFGALEAAQALGNPLTEPYWVQSGLGDTGVSLMQAFERRVVFYTPDLPVGERFSLANSGRQYYRWRYGTDPTPSAPASQRSLVPEAQDSAGLTLPDGYRANVLPVDAANIVDIAVAPDGNLALASDDGSIRFVTARGESAANTPPIETGLVDPTAIVYSGTDLFGIDSAGLHRFRDTNGDRTIDDERVVLAEHFNPDSVALAAGPDGALFVSGLPFSSDGKPATTDAVRQLYRIDQDGTSTNLAALDTATRGAVYADENGALWQLDDARQLLAFDPSADRSTKLLDAGALQSEARVVDLLAYRPDGAVGDPHDDLLALIDDAGNSRIVRLRPAVSATQTELGAGTPTAQEQPGAIVDFITGFEHPGAMATGLDGSLYVLDAGQGRIFRIQPK